MHRSHSQMKAKLIGYMALEMGLLYTADGKRFELYAEGMSMTKMNDISPHIPFNLHLLLWRNIL